MDRKISKLNTLFLLLFFAFIVPSSALAADITVTCDDDNGCDLSNNSPLFDENNIYPGWSTTKSIKVKNDYDEDREFMVEVDDLNMDGSVKLAKMLYITIKDGDGNTIYGPENLKDWEDEDIF